MANAYLLSDNLLLKYRESVSMVSENGVVGNFDLIYLNDKLASTICQVDCPAEGTNRLVFDFGQTVDCYGCVIINTDTETGDGVQFWAGATSPFIDPPAESESMVVATGVADYYLTGANPWSYRYFAIRHDDVSAKMGQVFLIGAAPYPFDRNVLWKFKNPNPFTFQGTVNPTGEEADTLVHEKFKERFALQAAATTQKDKLLEACRRRYVLWDIDGGSVPGMRYGRLKLAAEQTAQLSNQWGSEYLFTENPFTQVT